MDLYWVRSDFRVNNNNAIEQVRKNKEKKLALYIYNSEKFHKRSAQKWWLSQSIIKFEKTLSELGFAFHLLKGDEYEVLKKFVKDYGIKQIYYNKIFEPKELELDKKISKYFNLNLKIFVGKSNLLQNPFDVKKNDGTPFQVFTPFWKNAEIHYLNNNNIEKPKLKNIKNINTKNKKISEFIENTILPKKKWHKKFENIWNPGEKQAIEVLKKFMSQDISNYSKNRDIPSILGTSKLSPHIAFGEITSETIYSYFNNIKNKNINHRKFINEIGWREFSYHLLNHFPQIEKQNLRSQFDNFIWSNDKNKLEKWKQGKTGYPIVDAGMRELYDTGWMHNRVRMITSSFLVKHLRINWKEGESFFRDSLLDFNVGNNICGWQWVSGCGADAAPYFRIFNPILQGEKFDKDGLYVKKWIPSLQSIPKKLIHKPWEIDNVTAKKIGFVLERDYYKPIVDHKIARNQALAAFKKLRSK